MSEQEAISHALPSTFIHATEANGWHTTRYDDQDIADSLEALKEPPGIDLDSFRATLEGTEP